jgi:hypothetical protein
MKNFGTIGLAAASLFAFAAFEQGSQGHRLSRWTA